MAKRRKIAKVINENMNPMSFDWEDVFYITNLNDGTREYRNNKTDEAWYNLCLKPNPFYRECRHYCLGCGGTYEKFLNLISKYVSCYRDPEALYDFMRNLTDGGKCGTIMLEYEDDWWQDYGSTDFVTCYNDDINNAIEIGRQTNIYGNRHTNVKVTFNKYENSFSIEGKWGNWFEDFISKIVNFKGYTKVDFFKTISDDTDVACCNEIFAELKKRGVKGIKQMKQVDFFTWLDILAPLVNDWYFEDPNSLNDVYSDMEVDDD